jgi:hypothetical protein
MVGQNIETQKIKVHGSQHVLVLLLIRFVNRMNTRLGFASENSYVVAHPGPLNLSSGEGRPTMQNIFRGPRQWRKSEVNQRDRPLMFWCQRSHYYVKIIMLAFGGGVC